MATQRRPKHLVQNHAIFPEACLVGLRNLETKTRGYDCPPSPTLAFVFLPEEFEGASRDAGSLFSQTACCFAANCKPHSLHPISHGASQCYFAATGPDGLSLQVEKDHPGPGSIRNSENRSAS